MLVALIFPRPWFAAPLILLYRLVRLIRDRRAQKLSVGVQSDGFLSWRPPRSRFIKRRIIRCMRAILRTRDFGRRS
ncbi:hypothetical protein BDV27DRAFT_135054 [Aspergillus caelatus]|uniref:Uncharacterized protein n=1 Tax=Aspergillus caelatus TaxID=61420 RepID=A0A5N6ZV46_9EURO|nr:uncharacterized protein BDV27DRAFT_135054 [Aspergillus caelatus]KAE8360140.1 hypothetical protein BDV27DRAFT_135054 [Aspergillus caelatus]